MNKIVKYSCLSVFTSFVILACNGRAANQTDEQVNSNETTLPTEEGFVAMFASNSLEGWEGDTSIWRMEDGVLVGEIKANAEPLKNNTFLIWKDAEPADFILRTQFRISDQGNSGINYRSERFAEVPYALKGYQADIDGQHNYTGQNYEERNRTTLAYRGQRTEIPNPSSVKGESIGNAWSSLVVRDTVATPEELKELTKPGDWNEIMIVAEGNKLSHYINGKLISEVLDDDAVNRKEKGYIGVQVHVGPPMKIEYKDMQIKTINEK